MQYSFITFVLVWHITSSENHRKECRVTRNIQQVESGLTYPFQIIGQEVKKFTMAERMVHYRIPAVSIALINDGKIEWAKAYGQTEVNMTKKADVSTLFQAASISKAVAAVAALQLVDQGKVELDTNVNQYLKSWKVRNSSFTTNKPVTLRGLLTHTAGLTVSGFNGYAQGEAVPTINQILDGVKPANSVPIDSDQAPGTAWRYSGGGYTVMQKLIEDVTGSDLATLMDCTLLASIDMKDSTFEQTLPDSSQKRVAPGHLSTGEKVRGNWNVYPESAAAGLWTTASDLALFAIELQNSLRDDSSLVLSKQMSEKMLAKHFDKWGLGPELYGENESLAFGHTGSNHGYKCLLFATARTGQGVAIMTNADNGMNIIGEILRSIAIAYNWALYKPIPKNIVELTPAKLATFVGTYFTSQFNLSIAITMQDTHLRVKQLWDDTEFLVYSESERDFFAIETALSLQFHSAANGTVTGLRLADLNWAKIN